MSDRAADDEDWFERAVGEDGDSEEDGDAAEPDEDGPDDEALDADDDAFESGDGDEGGDPFDGSEGDDPSGDGDGAFGDGDDSFDESGDPFGDDDDSFGDDGDPFDGDSDPFGEGDDPFDESSDPFGEGNDPFGGDSEPVEEGSDEDDGGLFDDDFATAFESAPGPGGGDDFEDEEFESDIPRIDLGIDGLDGMIQGGVPERHLIVTVGSAGTGKTTFGLQFLNHGLERGESGVFITLEQSHEAIMDTAGEHGWDFETYEAEDRLAVIDLDPIEMANSLDNIRGELPELIERFDADRLVLDSVSLLEMMYDEQARRRTEVFDFTRSLKSAGVTTMLTSEADESNPYASRHGIIEYLTDAVFVLRYVRDETRETRLAVEIQKIRNANHSRETKPYEIETGGISVYQRANIF